LHAGDAVHFDCVLMCRVPAWLQEKNLGLRSWARKKLRDTKRLVKKRDDLYRRELLRLDKNFKSGSIRLERLQKQRLKLWREHISRTQQLWKTFGVERDTEILRKKELLKK